jgi:DNA polymerase III sliding clamp (beta) subunit (PCNA family)
MPNAINREELLQQLMSVQPGLSRREIIEQSSCFVFSGGMVMTYNDEIACTQKCSLNIEGAVQATPLLAILGKLPEDELEVETTDGELILKGKKRRAGIRREKEVALPIASVDKPTKWLELPADFLEAVTLVQHSASKDESRFQLTCIHIHPKYIEACDNYQITRYKMATGVAESTLVRSESLKHVPTLGMTEFCETESWLHFRNPNGLVLSCRRYKEDFPNLKDLLNFNGHKITLPKGLADAADKAKVFTNETSDDSQVLVELRTGKLRVKGVGGGGWYQEVKKLAYDGPDMSFMIAPDLLIEITTRHNDAEIAEGRLKVDGGKWRYVTSLGSPAETPDTGEDTPPEEAAKEKEGE